MLRKEKQKGETKRLGSTKFVEPTIQVLCTDELPNELRTLTPKFNLLEDRYKSLQQRNKIEPKSTLISSRGRRYALKHVETYRAREYRTQQERLYSGVADSSQT